MRVIKESLWQELADITDKRSLNGAKFSRTSIIMGFITGRSGRAGKSGLREMSLPSPDYTPEVLTLCPKCGHDQFQRRRSSRNSLISHSNKENMGRMNSPALVFISTVNLQSHEFPDDISGSG